MPPPFPRGIGRGADKQTQWRVQRRCDLVRSIARDTVTLRIPTQLGRTVHIEVIRLTSLKYQKVASEVAKLRLKAHYSL